jgi:hypothetical protein
MIGCRLAGATIRASPHPLGKQMPHLLREAHLAIQILRHFVVVAGLETQRPDSNLLTNAFAEADDCLSYLLSTVRLSHVDLIEQREFPMKFKAEAERQHKVSDHILLQQHQVHAAQAGIEQSFSERSAGHFFIESHLHQLIELSHQLDGSGQIAIGDQLEVGVY